MERLERDVRAAAATMTDESWPAGTPESVVAAYVAAMADERWADAASLIAPERGAAFVMQRRHIFLQHLQQRPPTAADDQRRNPAASPDEMAEHAAQHEQALAHRANEIALEFAGVSTDAELAALEPLPLLTSYLEAGDVRYQMKVVHAAAGRPLPENIGGEMEPPRVRILGHVVDGPERALVVFRECSRDKKGREVAADPEVIELTRTTSGDWRLPPEHQLTALRRGVVLLYRAARPADGPPQADAEPRGAEPTR